MRELCVIIIPNSQSFTNKRPYENSSDVSACPLTKVTGEIQIGLEDYYACQFFCLQLSQACGHISVAKNVRSRNSVK